MSEQPRPRRGAPDPAPSFGPAGTPPGLPPPAPGVSDPQQRYDVRGLPAASPVKGGRVSFPGVLKAEWIKLWSLPSTWWVLAATVLVTVGVGALLGASLGLLADSPGIDVGQVSGELTFRATDAAASGVFGQLVLSILAVLFVTGEYSSGQIRSTFTAVPGRISVLVAKTCIIAVVSGVVTLFASYGAVVAGWTLMPAGAIDDRFTLEGLRLIGGMALATALIALFALAVAFLVRSTAGGVGIVVAVLFILPMVLSLLSWDWVPRLHRYLLDMSQAGLYQPPSASMLTVGGGLDFLTALGVTAAWAFVPLGLAAVLLRRRDA